jgi:PhnB protein
MNLHIKIDDSIVMVSDEVPGAPTNSLLTIGTSTVTLHIYSENVDNRFWGDRYGQLVDSFGHHWSLAQYIKMCAKEIEEKQKAVMAMFSAREHP